MFSDFITFCATTDLEATTGFYGGILDLPLVLDQGRCRIWRVAEHGYIGFCQRDSVSTQGIILTLVSNDVDGWHRRLIEHGVPIEKAPARNPEYGIYHLFCRDPNGYLVEIQRFENEEWNKGTRRDGKHPTSNVQRPTSKGESIDDTPSLDVIPSLHPS